MSKREHTTDKLPKTTAGEVQILAAIESLRESINALNGRCNSLLEFAKRLEDKLESMTGESDVQRSKLAQVEREVSTR